MLYLLEIKNSTVFLNNIRQPPVDGIKVKKGNLYTFSDIRHIYTNYLSCTKRDGSKTYVIKADVQYYAFSLDGILKFFFGAEPTVKAAEDKLGGLLSCFFKIIFNKHDNVE
jgi:hypothetical protein